MGSTVLYVYKCAACGFRGELKTEFEQPEVVTFCHACGGEVKAEWDGGVTLD
jgi:predicted nucleic acid-binding Zn ribbon protein